MARSVIPGICCSALLFACLALLCPYAAAQHGGGGGGGGSHSMSPGGPGGPGGGMGAGPGGPGAGSSYAPHDNSHPGTGSSTGNPSDMRGGLQLGPPGRWWDDKHFAKDLKLRPDQQRRMDSIFEGNKPALLGRLATVQQEELRMDALTRARNPDENTLNNQIDRVWQARAELEKAKTHYLLQIRQEMDSDQISRLEDHH